MKKIIVLTVLFFTVFCSILANSKLTGFTNLRSQGDISPMLQKLLLSNDDDAVLVQNLAKSGRLLYGTDLNQYIEKITDNLLANKPELRKELIIFIVRSPAVNAMVSKQGLVLVNIGLIAQVTNESELAFILGHEISHYVENKNKKKKDVKISSLSSYLNYRLNSREEELEADRLSLENYLKDSPYSTSALENIFDVFRYSYLPFNEIPYARAEVETDFYTFPSNYFLKNVKEIRSRADYVDTLSTHPNLQKRQLQLTNFNKKNEDKGQKFVQNEPFFFEIRNLARLECINFYLTWHDYGNALINIMVLKKQLGSSEFLDVAEAAAYYGFHKHRMNGSIQDVVEAYKEIEGEKQQVCYFLRKLNKKEANALAVRKLLLTHKKYPNNDFLNNMTADAVYDLVKENKMLLQDFSDYAQTTSLDSINNNESENEVETEAKGVENDDKYSRIKGKITEQQLITPDKKFKAVNYMLVDLKRDSVTISFFDDALNKIDDEDALALASAENALINSTEKMIVWMPVYLKNKDQKTTYPALGNVDLTNTIRTSLKSTKIDGKLYDKKPFENVTTEEFNRISSVGQWRTEYGEINFSRMVLYQQPNLQKELSGFRYINLVTEVAGRTSYFANKRWNIFYRGLFMPISIPFDIAVLLLPTYSNTLNFNIYDIKTGQTIYSKRYSADGVNGMAEVNNTLYKYYFDLKNGIKLK